MVLGNSGNEYVLCSDQAIPLKAKLPPGKWTVKQCDVVNLQNQILSISASGDFDFRTPKSKAAITLFSLNDRQNPKAVPVKENIAKFIYNSGNEIQSSEVKNTRPMIKTVSADLEKAVVNEMYNEDLEARGGNPPLTWRSVDLPSGLLLEKEIGRASCRETV